MRTQFVCPFCKDVILETETTLRPDYDGQEATVRAHLLARHPIRWRLSRRFRAAMRLSRA